MESGFCKGTSSPSLSDFLAKSASGERISSQGAQPRSTQFLRRASSSVSLSLGPKAWRKDSSTGNSSEENALGRGELKIRGDLNKKNKWGCCCCFLGIRVLGGMKDNKRDDGGVWI